MSRNADTERGNESPHVSFIWELVAQTPPAPPPTHLCMENLTAMGIRLILDKRGGDSYGKEDLSTWFCMSRRCAIPRAGWTGQGQPQLPLSQVIKWSFRGSPPLFACLGELARSLAN